MFNQRELALIAALKTGRKTVQQLWSIAGNNPAEYVRSLRAKGACIVLHKIPHVTKEGRKAWHGEYELVEKGVHTSKQAA